MTEIPETKDIVKNRVTQMDGQSSLPAVQSPLEMISMAIQRGAGEKELAIIERMFAFDVTVKEQTAKEAFFKAKAAFKADAPRIIKDKANKQYSSMYASESAMLDPLNPALSKQGLEVSFDFPPPAENSMSVTCILTHELGHNQTVTLSGPLDTSGSKNPLQQVKSTATYLRKATFEAIVGIASSDPSDDDGNASAEVESINDTQFGDINALIKEVGADEPAFCKFLKIKSVDAMPAPMYKRAVKELERKR